MPKLISIIIATYNAEKTLEDCLQSIIAQKTDRTELIIVDGKSKDKTLSILERFRDSIDVLISEPDKGIYDAWNKGIVKSTGEWLMFIGADDELLPNAIQKYEKCIKETKDVCSLDYICAHNDYITQNGSFIKKIGKAPAWSCMRRYMSAAHVGSLHNKRNLFDQVGFYDLSFPICADYELLLRKRGHLKYFFIPDTIAKMKEGGMSMSLKAIVETYKIRKMHHTIPMFYNIVIMIKTILLYRFYKFHK